MSRNRTFLDLLIRSVVAVLLGIGLALLLGTKSVAADVHLDEIKTRTDVYEDVTVTGRNETDVFITHSMGMANVKIKDLDPETLWRVGLGPEPGSPEAVTAAEAAANQGKLPPALAKMFESSSLPAMQADLQEQVVGMSGGEAGALPESFQLNPQAALSAMMPILIGVLVVGFVFYLLSCLILRSIVKKTGTEPGFLIWLPILQLIPLLRAAGMSMMWFLLWISPLLVAFGMVGAVIAMGEGAENSPIFGTLSMVAMGTSVLQLIAYIVWAVKIVQAREKHVIWTILLILPLTNLIAFLYLAFSSAAGESGGEEADDTGKIIVHSAFSEA